MNQPYLEDFQDPKEYEKQVKEYIRYLKDIITDNDRSIKSLYKKLLDSTEKLQNLRDNTRSESVLVEEYIKKNRELEQKITDKGNKLLDDFLYKVNLKRVLHEHAPYELTGCCQENPKEE